ncbi:patatin-like phospholipase family protein [Corallococcus sp. H22C18031201]|uniref:patatin-like phospholipase family protein n=1 Tax=Citreicoccus inhibens TaxID=2849499 RepID=UPI000E72F0DF|nr:patatin-like phospholipase family protein [Citreicoccus inhibens]MBU8900349.1 patatin-like phospholipase family protein [Citreicoccus inhibens]RJS14332.1 patatin-like phospholipase family protein [Corallococcus sp. H22C18031201]
METNVTRRALVLGGGGVAGIAWEIGVLAGLAESGIDVTSADMVVGTSAGSVVAAQITSGLSMAELLARQVDPALQCEELVPVLELQTLWAAIGAIMNETKDVNEARRRFGALALSANTVSESARRAVIAGRLPEHKWPQRRLVLPAVDAQTGLPRLFTNDSGVELVDAVAASCAVPGMWPTTTIEGSRYLDGGIRSNENADLAAGFDRVLVLCVMEMPGAAQWRLDLDPQVAALRTFGSRVEVIRADEAAVRAFGTNPLAPSTRTPSAQAGLAQGRAEADRIRSLWM